MAKQSHKQFKPGEIVGRCRDQKHLASLRGVVISSDGEQTTVEWDWNHPYIRENHPHLWNEDGSLSIWGRIPKTHFAAELRKVEDDD